MRRARSIAYRSSGSSSPSSLGSVVAAHRKRSVGTVGPASRNPATQRAHSRIALAPSSGKHDQAGRRSAPPTTVDKYDSEAPGSAWIGDHRVSVVIPALNEAANLPHVLPRIPGWVHEVILVDGHSTDDTVEVAQRLWPGVRVVTQLGRGKGAALRTGFAAARGDIIVMLDADGSTDPAEIPAFVGALLAGADFVKGSRFVQGAGTSDMSHLRRLGNWGFVVLVRLLFGNRYSDLCYGYNAFWTRVLPRLNLDGDGFEIETIMNVRALRAKLKVAEVPSFESERVHGTSRLRTFPDGWRVLKAIWRERMRARPTAASTALPEINAQSPLVVSEAA